MSSYITTESKEIHDELTAHHGPTILGVAVRALFLRPTTPETKKFSRTGKLNFNQERRVCLGE